MRLFRRAVTNARVRKRSARATPSPGMAMRRPPSSLTGTSSRKDLVSSVVKQFHALSIDQRYRAVARVLQNNRNFNDEVELFFREADKDKDGLLNRHEFRSFLTTRFSLKTPRPHPASDSNARPSNHQLKLVILASAVPFVGFGFVDNIIMLAAGDMIEDHFHEAHHLSMLCAAAMGNTIANVTGLSLGGVIESMIRRVGIPDPMLSRAQAHMAITHWCNFFASAGGITVGCILGMFPLLFMSHEKYEQEVIEAEKKRVLALLAKENGFDGDEEDGDEQKQEQEGDNRKGLAAAMMAAAQSIVAAIESVAASGGTGSPAVA